MGDKNCPYFGIAPASFMSMEYCKLKSDGTSRFFACNSNEWGLCNIILERQRKNLEKELNGF